MQSTLGLIPSLAELLTIPMLAFPVFIGMIVYGVRRAVESGWPGAKSAWWWNEVFLYFAPILFGGALAVSLFGTYPFPSFVTHWQLAAMVGAIGGGSSGFAFKIWRNVQNRNEKKAEAALATAISVATGAAPQVSPGPRAVAVPAAPTDAPTTPEAGATDIDEQPPSNDVPAVESNTGLGGGSRRA